uniref:Uncharacterized protein n=1 Tax=Lactuca sativa TaxID=4236 RepID=A0A9R1VMZ0_LACSA|nr:hypothetical protein LSAT_V11C400217870 [Lactuca sativa]
MDNFIEQSHVDTDDDISKPTWENTVESPMIDYVSTSIPTSKYKIKLKYGGIFRLAKNTKTSSYNFAKLNDDVIKHYSSKNNPKFSIWYVHKFTSDRLYIQLDSEEKFIVMLTMYENEKEVTIYVTTENNITSNNLNVSNQLSVTLLEKQPFTTREP